MLRRLTSPPFPPEDYSAGQPQRGPAKILRWLAVRPGDTWQQRWEASGAEGDGQRTGGRHAAAWLRGNGGSRGHAGANELASGC